MNSASISYLDPVIWVLGGAITILVLLVVFGFYIYWRKREAACLADASDAAELAARKEILQADVEAIRKWIDDQRAELERLTAEREEQERLRAHLNDLEQQCATKDQENQGLRNEVGELENQRYLLAQTKEKLEREIGDLDAKLSAAQAIDEHLAKLRTQLEEAREAMLGLHEVQARLEALSAEKASLERTMEDRRVESDLLRTEVEQLRYKEAEARTEAEEAQGELVLARKETADLGVIVNTLRQEQTAIGHQLESLKEKVDDFKVSSQKAKEQAEKNVEEANKAKEEAGLASRELMDIQKEGQSLKVKLDELNARKAALQIEVDDLLSKTGVGPEEQNDQLIAYSDLLEKMPVCLSKDTFKEERDGRDEINALQQLKDVLRNEGLVFSSRIIDAFHTSLKSHGINPITVLAGVSGTGKTLLPMRYAEIMGMHRLVLAVQPRWDSPQDMFGFYNYLEKKYKATELSRALVRMDPYNFNGDEFSKLDSDWMKERLLLVLLDEMNLARTEYYFSEFLSKLELRRQVKDPSLAQQRSQAEVELDTGPGKHRFRIWVGENVFFVGTLNEDETTQTLSDKVLDRANVIRFGKPDEKTIAAKYDKRGENVSNGYLSRSRWKAWQRDLDEGADWCGQVVEWTKRLNSALDRVGRPFGFRVQQAIGHYVANYPSVDDSERYNLAFADQIEQKIIPKLRGIDIGNQNANGCLDEVESIIDELGDNELGNAFDDARNESENLGMFQWRGVTRRI